MVAAANRHHGEVRLYATRKDEELLLRDAPMPSEQGTLELLKDLKVLTPDVTHGMVQFHGGGRTIEQLETYGHDTIIRDKHQALYREHQTEFDAYRESILGHAQGASALFRDTKVGAVYTAAIGTEYLRHKLTHGLMPNEMHDEIRELQREARREINERNRDFVPPDEPLIYRDLDRNRGPNRDPLQDIHEDLDRQLDRYRTLEGAAPQSLRDDPLSYVNRMIEAHDSGDQQTFRSMTREAAQDPFAQQMQAQAANQVDHEERQARLMAEQQQNQQQQEMQHALVRGA